MGVALKDQNILYASENIGRIDIIIDPTQPQSVIVRGDTTLPAIANSTIQLTATVLPSTAIDKSVTWSSSDTNIATVNSSGLVTRVAALTSDDGQSYTVTITARASNDISTSVVISAAVKTLPSDAFAIFDGIVGEKEHLDYTSQRDGMTGQWRDLSGNGRNMLLGIASPLWGKVDDLGYFNCVSGGKGCIYGEDTDYAFRFQDAFTLNFVIEYNSESAYSTYLDCIASLNPGGTPRQQMGIGSRSEHQNMLFSTVNTGSGFDTDNTYRGQANLTGKRLLTYVRNGATDKIYVNGVKVGEDIIHANGGMDEPSSDQSRNIAFFATGAQATTVSGYNYFGKAYAVSVYNRALTAIEITEMFNYYSSRYSL